MDRSDLDLVIFDCDGVLIDSEPISCGVHAAELGRLGYRLSADDIMRRFTGMPDREMYEVIEQESGRRLPLDYDAKVKRLVEIAYRAELRAVPGVREALAAIGRRLCVASSSAPAKLRLGLELVGLYERFAPHVFSASMVRRGKPAPDLFLYAAARMDARPERCLVIEDSAAGVTAAMSAGMAAIGFCGASHCGPGHGDRLAALGARAVVSDMRALPAAIASARSG